METSAAGCRKVLLSLAVAIPALMLLGAAAIVLHAAIFNQRVTFLYEIGYWDALAWGIALQIACVVCLLALELWCRLRGKRGGEARLP